MKKFDILIDNINDVDTVYSKFVNTSYPFQASIARYVVSKLILSVDEVTGTNLKLNSVHCSKLIFAENEAKKMLLSKFNILPDNSADIFKQLTAIDKIVSKVNHANIAQIGCSFYADSFSVVVIFKSNNDHFDMDFTIIDGNTIDMVITYYNNEIQNVWSFKEANKEDMTKDDIILRSYGRMVTHYLSLGHRINNKRDNIPEGSSYIHNSLLKDIADATKTPKSELDAQIENLFKIITHFSKNFAYKKVSIIYMGVRTISAVFRVTHCEEDGLSAYTYDVSITLEADENGYIKSITGIAHHKDGIVLYDKKDGLRPLVNWWECKDE